MADGDPYNSARSCAHPKCDAPVKRGQGNHRYCAEHSAVRREPRGRTYPKVVVMHGHLRPESVIRADLAAQLTVAVRRFNSMVAHDRSTDPVEDA